MHPQLIDWTSGPARPSGDVWLDWPVQRGQAGGASRHVLRLWVMLGCETYCKGPLELALLVVGWRLAEQRTLTTNGSRTGPLCICPKPGIAAEMASTGFVCGARPGLSCFGF